MCTLGNEISVARTKNKGDSRRQLSDTWFLHCRKRVAMRGVPARPQAKSKFVSGCYLDFTSGSKMRSGCYLSNVGDHAYFLVVALRISKCVWLLLYSFGVYALCLFATFFYVGAHVFCLFASLLERCDVRTRPLLHFGATRAR